MTFTFNGCGTSICGQVEFVPPDNVRASLLDFELEHPNCHYRVGTKTITLVWVPVIPYETVVTAEFGSFLNEKYIELWYPCGEGKVCWELVKGQWQFYITPIIIALCISSAALEWIWAVL
jgi:hypothetical protein